MELRHLRYFVAIVECNGFRKASEHLHVAQPALSQTVIDLEYELGSKLLIRDQRGVTLTAVGKEFYSGAKKTLEAARETIHFVRCARDGITGSLTIGFIPGAVQHFLPSLLHKFKEEAPSVKFHLRELSPSSQMRALNAGEIDLAFTREPTIEEQRLLSTRWLFAVPLMAVLPSSDTLGITTIPIASLSGRPFNLIGRDQSPKLFDSIIELCLSLGFSPKVTSYADLSESMFTLVEAGEGVSIAPLWTRVFLPKDLRSYRIEPDTVQVELVAAWKADIASCALQRFIRLLDEEMENIQARSREEFSIMS